MAFDIITPSPVRPFLDDQFRVTQESKRWMEDITTDAALKGIGSPEGVVSARQPRRYIDTSAVTLGTDVYIKRSDSIGGDDKLGWVLISGSSENTTEIDGDTTLTGNEDFIFVDGTATITLQSANGLGYKMIVIRNISGTTTIGALTGTVETTSLTVGTAITLAPRISDNTWYAV